MQRSVWLSLWLVLLLLTGCGRGTPYIRLLTGPMLKELPSVPVATDVLTFGFDRRLDAAEDARMYLPFLRYLEGATGYRFRLQPLSRTESVVEALGNGRIDFAAIGALSYLEASARYGVKALVAARTENGLQEYRSLLITQPDSDIRALEDLRGRSLALGAATSTQGNLIPKIVLSQARVEFGDLASVQHHSSHFETANAVISGRFDVGAIQDTLGRELARKNIVRILHESPPFPSSTISVSPQVPTEVAAVVKRALLEFQPAGRHADMLYRWDQSEMPLGFAPVDEEAMERVRVLAEQVGLLRKGPQT